MIPPRLLAGVLLCAGCSLAQAGPQHRYLAKLDESLERLAIEACFNGAAPAALVTGSDAAHLYLESMRAATAPAGEIAIERGRASLRGLPENACIEYVVQLRPAHTGAQTGGPETRRIGRDLLTAIGDWLWRPEQAARDESIEIRFALPDGIAVSAPWARSRGTGLPAFRIGGEPPAWPGVVAFGGFQPVVIGIGGADIELAILDAPQPAQQQMIERWVAGAARGMTTGYGRFPVARLQVVVSPTPRGRAPVPWAYVARGGGPAVHLFINPTREPAEFERDWTVTHEMSHLFLPFMAAGDAWFYEGLATYLQNLLMARADAIPADAAWRRMHDGFASGSRTAPGLSVLQATERLGRRGMYLRVYWGGAAYFFAADLRLRAAGGRLDDALAHLARCCLAEHRRWTAEELIAELDTATGTTIFRDLAQEMLTAPDFPDTGALFGLLGVQVLDDRVAYRDDAPLAALRDALFSQP